MRRVYLTASPGAIYDATLESPSLQERVSRPAAIQEGLNALQSFPFLVLTGGTGSGKTTLAVALLRARAPRFLTLQCASSFTTNFTRIDPRVGRRAVRHPCS